MKCRICDKNTKEFFKINKVPLQVSMLMKKANSKNLNSDISFYTCENCGHYQIEYINNDDYYDYLMQVSYSNQMSNLFKKELECILQHTLKTDNFLEIGSGDGQFLQKVSESFKNCVGYEPSKSFHKLCLEKKLNVFQKYFPSSEIEGIKFDAFASRQVFEHLPNPKEVLLNIYKHMDDDSIGLIEVPSGKKIVREGRYFEIISDHVNYFTPKSLLYLVESCGFDVIELKEEFYGDYLVIYIKKNKKYMNIIEAKQSDYTLINKLFTENKNIVVWGAGAKAFNFMVLLENDSNVIKYVDGDKYKHGLFLPNASKQIENIDESIINSDLIAIFASSYEKEIIKILKEMGYKNNIFSFITKSIQNISEVK